MSGQRDLLRALDQSEIREVERGEPSTRAYFDMGAVEKSGFAPEPVDVDYLGGDEEGLVSHFDDPGDDGLDEVMACFEDADLCLEDSDIEEEFIEEVDEEPVGASVEEIHVDDVEIGEVEESAEPTPVEPLGIDEKPIKSSQPDDLFSIEEVGFASEVVEEVIEEPPKKDIEDEVKKLFEKGVGPSRSLEPKRFMPEPDRATFRARTSIKKSLIEPDETREPVMLASLSTEPKLDFTDILRDLLNDTPPYNKHKNVWIQSIKRREKETRTPIYVVTFVYGEQQMQLGRIYTKDYEGLDPAAKRRDTVLPFVLSQQGVRVATVINFNPEEGFDRRYALFQPKIKDQVIMEQAGDNDYASIIPHLKPQIVLRSSLSAIELMALMHVKGTEKLELIKSYGVELDITDPNQLLRERFLQYLEIPAHAGGRFLSIFSDLTELEKLERKFLQQADFTLGQLRMGTALNELYLLDFELAHQGALCVEDLAMYNLCLLRAKQDMTREDIETKLTGHYHGILQSQGTELPLEHIENDRNIETLRGHLYKIGDQIWTLDKFVESEADKDQRKDKSAFHLRQFFEVAHEMYGTEPAILKSLMTAVRDVIELSPKLPYLSNIIKEIESQYGISSQRIIAK